MILSIIASLTGCILTFVQMALIFYKGDGICFNTGCAVVDGLTLVPPFYFNLAGFLFFLFVTIGLIGARKGSEEMERFAGLLLLAGTAAEGILFSFQLFITEVFCSYCLVIFALVLAANLFMGIKQIFKASVIFVSILVAFASLDFRARQRSEYASLDSGSIARLKVESSERTLYLLFSSSCIHCEKVIEEMKQGIGCSINFNPLDRLESFEFPGAESSDSYSTQANLNFLKSLDLRGVPVLVDKHGGTTTIWTGARTIRTFLDLNCSISDRQQIPETPIGQTSTSTLDLPLKDGDCSIEEDCGSQTSILKNTEQQTTIN